MERVLNYIYDPLCGWCYGACGILTKILNKTHVNLRLIPAGLFLGDGARGMDEHFARYAWSNDQRISALTGQIFSDQYKTQILGSRTQRFDSGPMTLALTAVYLTEPEREYEALQQLQQARYVDGRDVTDLIVLRDILARNGFSAAHSLLLHDIHSVSERMKRRVAEGQKALQDVGIHGVPTFILHKKAEPYVISSQLLFSDPEAFCQALQE